MSYRLVVSSRAVGRQILSDRKCCRTFFDHLKRTFKSFTAILHSINGSTTTTSRISDQIEKSESRSEKGTGSGIDNDSRSHVEASDKDIESLMVQDMLLFRDFLSVEEEQSLLDEVEPYLKRLKYEYDHWDNAIHGFRETERKHWSSINKQILERVKTVAFPPPVPALAYVHLLDLAEDGYIKPHIDAVRFCGNTIAGLSLLSPCVMKLVHDKEKEKFANVILPQRSLYIMRGRARYDFTHEVLSNDHSSFKGETVHKGRRISVICRNEPTKEDV